MSEKGLNAINLLSIITEELSDEQFEDLREIIEELDSTIRELGGKK